MSANRGFLGNGHFKSANKWLAERYGPEGEVDWCSVANPNPPSVTPSTFAPAQASSPALAPASSPLREPSPELAVTPPPDATGDEAEMDALDAEPVTVRAEAEAATTEATMAAEDDLVGSVSEAEE